MPFAGEFAMLDWHGHMTKVQLGLLAAASPIQLGFGVAPFLPARAYDAVTTTTTGLADNKELHQRILHKLSEPIGPSEPSIVCTIKSRVSIEGGKMFDRYASQTCNPWRFALGEQFTVVTLTGPVKGRAEGIEGASMATDSSDDPNFAYYKLFPMHAGKKAASHLCAGNLLVLSCTMPDLFSLVLRAIRLLLCGRRGLTLHGTGLLDNPRRCRHRCHAHGRAAPPDQPGHPQCTTWSPRGCAHQTLTRAHATV